MMVSKGLPKIVTILYRLSKKGDSPATLTPLRTEQLPKGLPPAAAHRRLVYR